MLDIQQPSLLRRFAIINYDTLLLMAVSIAYGLVYIGINKIITQSEADNAKGLLFQVGWLLSIFAFFCYFWMRGGQTTGMRAWRVQIVSVDGTAPSLSQCIVRFLLAALGWAFFFTCFFHPQQQMLHDCWSNTQLILVDKHKQ